MKLIVSVLYLIIFSSPIYGYGDEWIAYDPLTKKCLNDIGEPASYSKQLRSCGELSGIDSSYWNRLISYRRENRYSLNLRGLKIKNSNLRKVDFSGLDLEGVEFENVDLTDSDFSSSNLRNSSFNRSDLTSGIFEDSDLRGASFVGVDSLELRLRGAKVDERTLFDGSKVNCEMIKNASLEWKSRIVSPCDSAIEVVEMGGDFREAYPEALVLKKEDRFIFLAKPIVKFIPIPAKLVEETEFGINRWDMFELLCAVKISSCLRSRRGVSNSYEIRHLPGRHLNEGIEFYHAKANKRQNNESVRFIGFSELQIDIGENVSEAISLAAKHLRIDRDRIVAETWMNYIDQIQIRFDFISQRQEGTQCDVIEEPQTLKRRIKCRVIIDQSPPADQIPQWLSQLRLGWARAAQTSSASLGFSLQEGIESSVSEGDARWEIAIPIKNMNFWEIQNVYRKVRY